MDFSNIKNFEDFKFEAAWDWNHYVMSPIRSVRDGLKNFWKWKKVIWNDRWWDHDFLEEIIKFKLQDMHDNWDKSWQCAANEKKAEIKKLLDILDEIERLQNIDDGDSDDWKVQEKQIDDLYQEFGERLFTPRDFEQKDCDGKVEVIRHTSLFRTLWD